MSKFYFLLITDIAFAILVLFATLGNFIEKRIRNFIFYIIISLLFIAVISREIGIGADDYYYVIMARDAEILPLSYLLDKYGRDPVYFSILYFLAPIFGIRSLVIISSIVFLVKMFYINKMVEDKILALLAYLCLSFFLQDVIQLRASLAAMFMIMAIYFSQRSHYIYTFSSIALAGLSHYTGYLVVILLKTIKSRPILYVAPLAVATISILGAPGIPLSIISQYIPDDKYISRYVEASNTLNYASFNSATIILLISVAVSRVFINKNKISAIGIFSVNISAISFFLFKEAITFSVRLSELFISFYALNVGHYAERRLEARKAFLIFALSVYYIRLRWIGLISYNSVL